MAQPPEILNDPLRDRQPTSHERLHGQLWDASYQNGPAPWDIGQPQPAIAHLASQGAFTGRVLDAGCGTGEHALLIASLGCSVLGVDVAETALAMARKKAAERRLDARFTAADALHLDRLARTFDTVLDCGLFHTLESDERLLYAASLGSVTEQNGTLYLLCFREDGPGSGPHPVREEELRAPFNSSTEWAIVSIEPETIHTRFHANGAPAWLATIKRT